MAARDMSDLSIRFKAHGRARHRYSGDLSDDFYFSDGRRADIDLAICRSYNRWMADIVKPRRRTVFVGWSCRRCITWTRVADELKFGKEHGACGVYLRGLEADRRLSDPYFYPLYERRAKLDLPFACTRRTAASRRYDFFLDEPGFCKFKLAVIGAFHSLVYRRHSRAFPKLRIGIIEVSAQWIPYAIHDLSRRYLRRGKQLSENVLKENRIYVTCQTDDDLDHVLATPVRIIWSSVPITVTPTMPARSKHCAKLRNPKGKNSPRRV